MNVVVDHELLIRTRNMDKNTDTLCGHTRIRLIAAAISHQQCKKTAANAIPISGTSRFIIMGTAAAVFALLRTGSGHGSRRRGG
jgi:hypothetical protein